MKYVPGEHYVDADDAAREALALHPSVTEKALDTDDAVRQWLAAHPSLEAMQRDAS